MGFEFLSTVADLSVERLFDGYNVQTLHTMALATGVLPPKSKKPNKEGLVSLLREKLFVPTRVDLALAQLSELEKAVLNRLLLHDEAVRTSAFRRELVRAGLVTLPPEPEKQRHNAYYYRTGPNYTGDHYLGEPNRTHSTIFQDVIASLTHQGLVFSQLGTINADSASKLTFHPADELIIPPQLRRLLPAPTPIVSATQDWQPARVERSSPLHLLRELYLYWDFVRRNEVALLQNGLVGKRLLRLLGQVLLTQEPRLETAGSEMEAGRIYLLRQLLEALKLIHNKNGKLVITTTEAMTLPAFWTNQEQDQLLACLRAWLTVGGAGQFDAEIERYYPQYRLARQTLLKTLPNWAIDWCRVDDLLDALLGQDENFLFQDRASVERQGHQVYYSGRYSGTPSQLLKNFAAAEERFVRTAVMDLLFPFGLVEVGYAMAEATAWAALRLTTLGQQVLRALAGKEPQTQRALSIDETNPVQNAEGQEQGRLVIQPNFQLLAIGPVALATLAQLDLFAERRKADVSVFEYHLSRESVYQGQQAGLHIQDIISFLQTTSRAPLPQNLERSLNEWGAHHERIVIRTRVSLLQAADEASLATLLADAAIGQQVERIVAPGVALVKKAADQPLLQALLARGLLPALSNDQPASADHSVQIDKTGLITPIHAVPSLHLSGRLARFAEAQTAGVWQLTPATVRRAGGSRKKVLALLEELTKLQRGPLPSELADRVKQWGSYYGAAAAATLTLIEFSDPQALQELLAHPDLQTHLTPFPAGNRALAMIRSEQLPEVMQLLQRLGITVKQGLLQ